MEKLTFPEVASLEQSDVLQVKCYTSDEGHVWIADYDKLPPAVRRRLRESSFNLCAACLEAFVLPEVHRRHPSYPRQKALFAAIELMEAEVRRIGDGKFKR
jgi:hypothetical protein